MTGLKHLKIENSYIDHLPVDPIEDNYTRQVVDACASKVSPIAFKEPELVAYSKEVGALLNLAESDLKDEGFLEVFSGKKLLKEMVPYAACYGGHQFGNWAGQLGDGRAINLGEVLNQEQERWTLQLKGAGPTPYSRRGDGLAVLRSSVREFLCSEAMFHLGVPTTRALSLVLSGEQVMRDMFYDGRAAFEPGAIVCRVAPSFTRFGNFQIFTARRRPEILKQLIDYTLKTDFPHLGEPSEKVYLEWFQEICTTTVEMIIHWMRVGFVHGVMNTDNMSILGLTIDYGPYGWLEGFEPGWTPNTTDAMGKRYAYGNQPLIAHWNLAQLAQSIVPVVEDIDALQAILDAYPVAYQSGFLQMMADKLGLKGLEPVADQQFVEDLHQILQLTETDMTIFFRELPALDIEGADELSDEALMKPLQKAYYTPAEITVEEQTQIANWLRTYGKKVRQEAKDPLKRKAAMNAVNPKYVLRNYMAQLAIDQSEQGDHSLVSELLELLRNPYAEQADREKYYARRPEWARNRPGCSMLSCSS